MEISLVQEDPGARHERKKGKEGWTAEDGAGDESIWGEGWGRGTWGL